MRESFNTFLNPILKLESTNRQAEEEKERAEKVCGKFMATMLEMKTTIIIINYRWRRREQLHKSKLKRNRLRWQFLKRRFRCFVEIAELLIAVS